MMLVVGVVLMLKLYSESRKSSSVRRILYVCVWRRCRRRRFSVLSLNLGVNWCNSRPTTTQPIVSKNIQKKWKKMGFCEKKQHTFGCIKRELKSTFFWRTKKSISKTGASRLFVVYSLTNIFSLHFLYFCCTTNVEKF